MNGSALPAYQVNPDDLPNLDQKAQQALRPLLENLNNVLRLLVAATNTPKDVVTSLMSFTTNSLGSAYVEISNPLPLKTSPKCVLVAELQRLDERPVDNVYSFWWTRTTVGIRALFVGLDATRTYSYALRVQ